MKNALGVDFEVVEKWLLRLDCRKGLARLIEELESESRQMSREEAVLRIIDEIAAGA